MSYLLSFKDATLATRMNKDKSAFEEKSVKSRRRIMVTIANSGGQTERFDMDVE